MVKRIESDADILATSAVMRDLRPHIDPDAYLPIVRRMMTTDGYRLAAACDDGTPGMVRAVAGYRFMEMLYCGRILYVDDLNTDPEHRSKGHGVGLLNWLKAEAKANRCTELHLDSAVRRARAHRFYFREGLAIGAFHFDVKI